MSSFVIDTFFFIINMALLIIFIAVLAYGLSLIYKHFKKNCLKK
jgi:hypothetical protein